MNDHLVMISGKSSTGKSSSLRNLAKPESVMYLCTENNKRLPFKSGFKEYNITDPLQVIEAFEKAEEMDKIETIIIDSLTFLMDQYESQYVLTSTNKMTAWGEFAQYFKNMMTLNVARSSKNVIFTAHTLDIMNEADMCLETKIPVKGSLKNNGLESYFSTVVSTKVLPLNKLKGYENPLLEITEDEEILGMKYVFQTRLTKETVGERIRSPLGMWSKEETYIDNDVQKLMNRLHEYYK